MRRPHRLDVVTEAAEKKHKTDYEKDVVVVLVFTAVIFLLFDFGVVCVSSCSTCVFSCSISCLRFLYPDSLLRVGPDSRKQG